MKKQFQTIDAYIKAFPEDIQRILEKMRQTIRKTAPEAEEAIAYQMPTFKLNGKNLVHFAAFKNHIGFYPTPSGIEAFSEQLSPYKGAKGSVKFPLGRPIPLDLVQKIVKLRVKENMSRRITTPHRTIIRRPRYPMPDFIRQALLENKMMDAYLARPPYQQNDYIGWINRAVQDRTKQKRLDQMINELKSGDVYMKMAYKPKN